MHSDDVPRMNIREFREAGYLQEVNRLFFHPLGLALEVVLEDGVEMRFGGVWDYRDDPEGMMYGEPFTDADRQAAALIEEQRQSKRAAREAIGIWPVQPLA